MIEWFADFYGKDLETGQELMGSSKKRFFGRSGLTKYLFNYNNLEIEAGHKQKKIFPIEEEVYEKIEFDAGWKPIEGNVGDSMPELLRAGHLQDCFQNFLRIFRKNLLNVIPMNGENIFIDNLNLKAYHRILSSMTFYTVRG